MQRRILGATDLEVSERGFGAWAIGGSSYGPVPAAVALDALARAEALGCNVVDTAAVYGESEAVLGRFLPGRRERWVVASKYSGQAEGMTAVVDAQLARLRTDRLDVYQIHFAPRGDDERLFDELVRLKEAGKIRFGGVSLRSAGDIEHVLGRPGVDVLQMPVSLLDPEPLSRQQAALAVHRPGVIARSALRGGFLTGKYDGAARFASPADQRSQWDAARIRTLAAQADAFRFLGEPGLARTRAALAYPLSFPAVSTVIVSCKDSAQVEANFGSPLPVLAPEVLAEITATQRRLGLGHVGLVQRAIGRILAGLRRR